MRQSLKNFGSHGSCFTVDTSKNCKLFSICWMNLYATSICSLCLMQVLMSISVSLLNIALELFNIKIYQLKSIFTFTFIFMFLSRYRDFVLLAIVVLNVIAKDQ